MNIFQWGLVVVSVLLVARAVYARFFTYPVCPTKMDNGYCQHCDQDKDVISIAIESD